MDTLVPIPAAAASSAFIRHTTFKRISINYNNNNNNNIVVRCVLRVELGDRKTERKATTKCGPYLRTVYVGIRYYKNIKIAHTQAPE